MAEDKKYLTLIIKISNLEKQSLPEILMTENIWFGFSVFSLGSRLIIESLVNFFLATSSFLSCQNGSKYIRYRFFGCLSLAVRFFYDDEEYTLYNVFCWIKSF